nr:hypothetical protein [Tanacetum cinerariifolium]
SAHQRVGRLPVRGRATSRGLAAAAPVRGLPLAARRLPSAVPLAGRYGCRTGSRCHPAAGRFPARCPAVWPSVPGATRCLALQGPNLL